MEAWREELYHHGILGQKWGVRRYQNLDGTLTAAGRKRLYKQTVRESIKEARQENKLSGKEKANIISYSAASTGMFFGTLALSMVNPVAGGIMFAASVLTDAVWGASIYSAQLERSEAIDESAANKVVEKCKNIEVDDIPSMDKARRDVAAAQGKLVAQPGSVAYNARMASKSRTLNLDDYNL